jgi:chromate reductase
VSTGPLRVVGLAGSLRAGSYNRLLLQAACELAPCELRIEPFELAPIPLYNADDDGTGSPPAVVELRRRIGEADGLLIATPEYNYSIPGVLKNALDWASRPASDSCLRRKPVGVLGAASGQFGSVRAQLALRQVFVTTESYAMPKPEVLVARARERFDADGRLADGDTRAHLAGFLEAFAAWVERMR